jgi:hypothetical protein
VPESFQPELWSQLRDDLLADDAWHSRPSVHLIDERIYLWAVRGRYIETAISIDRSIDGVLQFHPGLPSPEIVAKNDTSGERIRALHRRASGSAVEGFDDLFVQLHRVNQLRNAFAHSYGPTTVQLASSGSARVVAFERELANGKRTTDQVNLLELFPHLHATRARLAELISALGQ